MLEKNLKYLLNASQSIGKKKEENIILKQLNI